MTLGPGQSLAEHLLDAIERLTKQMNVMESRITVLEMQTLDNQQTVAKMQDACMETVDKLIKYVEVMSRNAAKSSPSLKALESQSNLCESRPSSSRIPNEISPHVKAVDVETSEELKPRKNEYGRPAPTYPPLAPAKKWSREGLRKKSSFEQRIGKLRLFLNKVHSSSFPAILSDFDVVDYVKTHRLTDVLVNSILERAMRELRVNHKIYANLLLHLFHDPQIGAKTFAEFCGACEEATKSAFIDPRFHSADFELIWPRNLYEQMDAWKQGQKQRAACFILFVAELCRSGLIKEIEIWKLARLLPSSQEVEKYNNSISMRFVLKWLLDQTTT